MLPPDRRALGREKLDVRTLNSLVFDGDSQARELRCAEVLSLSLTNNHKRLLL